VPALEFRGVIFAYPGHAPVLRELSLVVEQGALVMVVGASGSGKTTLLKLAKGLLPLEGGEIFVLGQPVRWPGACGRLDRRVAYIPQHLGLVRTLTVLDNTLIGALGRAGLLRSLLHRFPPQIVQQAREVLDALGIGAKAEERVYRLSGGERQRVAIARALMQQPRLILADEFISQLDPATAAEIMQAMRRIADSGVALLVTTHDFDIVGRFADRVVVLREGKKVLDCPAHEVPVEELTLSLR
jgi:phosphonate transport system ATP-binding protein